MAKVTPAFLRMRRPDQRWGLSSRFPAVSPAREPGLPEDETLNIRDVLCLRLTMETTITEHGHQEIVRR